MEIILFAQTVDIKKIDVLKEVTAETINKVYNPSEYSLALEEVLRAEFSLVEDENFWFNKYLRDASYEVAGILKSLNKSEMPSYQIGNINVQFLVTVGKEYNINPLKDLCTSALVSKIVCQWYKMKNRMDLYQIYELDARNGIRKLKSISTSGVGGSTALGNYGNMANVRYNIGFANDFNYCDEVKNSNHVEEEIKHDKYLIASNIKGSKNISIETKGNNVTVNAPSMHTHSNLSVLEGLTDTLDEDKKLKPEHIPSVLLGNVRRSENINPIEIEDVIWSTEEEYSSEIWDYVTVKKEIIKRFNKRNYNLDGDSKLHKLEFEIDYEDEHSTPMKKGVVEISYCEDNLYLYLSDYIFTLVDNEDWTDLCIDNSAPITITNKVVDRGVFFKYELGEKDWAWYTQGLNSIYDSPFSKKVICDLEFTMVDNESKTGYVIKNNSNQEQDNLLKINMRTVPEDTVISYTVDDIADYEPNKEKKCYVRATVPQGVLVEEGVMSNIIELCQVSFFLDYDQYWTDVILYNTGHILKPSLFPLKYKIQSIIPHYFDMWHSQMCSFFVNYTELPTVTKETKGNYTILNDMASYKGQVFKKGDVVISNGAYYDVISSAPINTVVGLSGDITEGQLSLKLEEATDKRKGLMSPKEKLDIVTMKEDIRKLDQQILAASFGSIGGIHSPNLTFYAKGLERDSGLRKCVNPVLYNIDGIQDFYQDVDLEFNKIKLTMRTIMGIPTHLVSRLSENGFFIGMEVEFTNFNYDRIMDSSKSLGVIGGFRFCATEGSNGFFDLICEGCVLSLSMPVLKNTKYVLTFGFIDSLFYECSKSLFILVNGKFYCTFENNESSLKTFLTSSSNNIIRLCAFEGFANNIFISNRAFTDRDVVERF